MPSSAATASRAAQATKSGTRGMPRGAREQLILDVAGQAFARGGYHSASMDEIAELAGISKPMLYAYFGSKDGLYVAYIDREGKALVDRLVRAAAGAEDPRSRLSRPISEFLAFVEEHRDGWTVLFGEMTSRTPLAEEVAALRGRIAEAIRRMLDESGACAAPSSDAIAHAIVGAGESLANWWLEHPEVARREVEAWYIAVVEGAVGGAAR